MAAGPHFPSRGHAPVPPPLVLNWAAATLREAVHTRSEAAHWGDIQRPADLPVLTGQSSAAPRPCALRPALSHWVLVSARGAASGERYTLEPQSEAWARWRTQPKPWVPRSAFVLELLHKIENILDDRNLFQSHCAKMGGGGVETACVTPRSAGMTPRVLDDQLDRAGFLRLLRSADIVGDLGGMVDDQFALNIFLKFYLMAGHKGTGAQPRISFDLFQLCLFQIGSHAADMDSKSLIPEREMLEVISPAMSGPSARQSSARTTRVEITEESSAGAGWSSPRKMNETRARSAAVPNSKVAVPGPGMYVKHLFTPFPNKSIFPGGMKSAGGVRGWTWGASQQRNFIKDSLQEIGQSPGPAAYGDNNLGMNRPQIAYGTGRLPGAATHALFGTAERQVSVAHKRVAGFHCGVTGELLNGVPQVRKPMLRKGDRKFSFSDVSDVVPTKQQLKEARNFLDYTFQQERLREKPPPSELVRTVNILLHAEYQLYNRVQ